MVFFTNSFLQKFLIKVFVVFKSILFAIFCRWRTPAKAVRIPLDAGTVVESGYTDQFDPVTNSIYDRFTFSTMHTPNDGDHPVSGNRRFGIYNDPNGGYTFYVGGLDGISVC